MHARILWVVAVIGALVLSACAPPPAPAVDGGSDVPAADAPAAGVSAETITLTYTDWDAASEEQERQMVAICEEDLGVQVDFQIYAPASDTYWPRLQALAAAEDLPDVFAMSSGFIDEWATDGLVRNIQSYVDRDIMPQADNYFTGSFDQARFPDKVAGDMHAFPYAFVETVLFYRQDLFDEVGIDYPTGDWTWDDFLAAAQALTKPDEDGDGFPDRYGYYFYGRYAHIESWIYQNNGDLLNDAKTAYAPDEAAIETLRFLNSLVNEHGVAPQPADVEGIGQRELFIQGDVAMWIDGAWNIDNFRSGFEGTDTPWAIAPIPRGPNWQQDVAYGWPDLLAVSPFSDHPDEAWALIECLTGPLRTLELVKAGKIPVYRPVVESDAFAEADLMPPNKPLLLEWAQYIGPNSFTPGWGEWRGYVGGAGFEGQFTEVLNGNLTLDEALANIEQVANEVLQRYYPDQ